MSQPRTEDSLAALTHLETLFRSVVSKCLHFLKYKMDIIEYLLHLGEACSFQNTETFKRLR